MTKKEIYFENPASCFEETFLLGNGTLGATLYGGTDMEVIELNHERFWGDTCEDKANYEAHKYIDKARELVKNNDYDEANKLIADKILGPISGSFVSIGTLLIKDGGYGAIYDYKRSLDVSSAVVDISYTRPNTSKKDAFKTEKQAFVSFKNNVFIMKYTADEGKKLSLTVCLMSDFAHKLCNSKDVLHITSKAPYKRSERHIAEEKETISGNIAVKAVSNGALEVTDNMIMITDATEVIFYVTAETNFVSYKNMPDTEKDIKGICEERIANAEKIGYDRLYKEHIEYYNSLFNRSSFEIADYSDTPVNKLIENARKGQTDIELIQRLFDFSKYLFICSASGTEPANLQGIWNRIIEPPFASGYTTNINLEMNYWASEALNLSILNEGLFNIIDDLCQSGRRTADIHYNKKGSCVHHATDLWRVTAAVPGNPRFGFWPMAGGWFCRHLWEHYEYNKDAEFLKGKTYENIYAFTEFFADWVIEEDDVIKTRPSTSPENRFISKKGNEIGVAESSTMDLTIIVDTFNIFIKVSDILGENSELLDRVKVLRDKIKPFRIGSDGRLLEWGEELPEAEPGHRHFSHMYGLYPAKLIEDEKIIEACKRSIEKRMENGGAYTGWSCVWLICLYARLKEADIVEKYMNNFLSEALYDNLLAAHPPFQIDANFGFLAAVCETLVQTEDNEVILLPSIPKSWKNGEIKGIKIPNNIKLDITWENSKITSYHLSGENINISEIGEFDFGKIIKINKF